MEGKGTGEKVNNDSQLAPQILPNEVLEQVFMRMPEHWQIYTGPFISRFFFSNRYKPLPKIVSRFELDSLLAEPIFQKYPIDYFKFYQRGKTCLPLMAQRFTSASCLAAFVGNLPALNELLGEAMFEPLDETGCRVVHFLALGGQNDLLLSLVETHGAEILQVVDNLGHSLLHFAALGMNIKLVRILFEKYNFLAQQTANLFGQTWLHMLADREISESNLLILSDLIYDQRTFEETKEQLIAESYDLTSLDFIPDFAGQYDMKSPESLDQLIIAVVREIVTKRQSHFDAYLCYLIAFKQLNLVPRDDLAANTL